MSQRSARMQMHRQPRAALRQQPVSRQQRVTCDYVQWAQRRYAQWPALFWQHMHSHQARGIRWL